jgi:hypothetical protein
MVKITSCLYTSATSMPEINDIPNQPVMLNSQANRTSSVSVIEQFFKAKNTKPQQHWISTDSVLIQRGGISSEKRGCNETFL